MKTIGVIGGFGHETTARFQLQLFEESKRKGTKQNPDILVHLVPIPKRIEKKLLSNGEGIENYFPYLVDSAQLLEHGGAEVLVMPCNTLHAHIGGIRENVQVEMLSIIDESVKYLQREGVSRVGLLATSSTLNDGLYSNKLDQVGIAYWVPNVGDQRELDGMIGRLVDNMQEFDDRDKLNNMIDSFHQEGADHVLLACTDLPNLQPEHPRVKIHSSQDILAKATIDYI